MRDRPVDGASDLQQHRLRHVSTAFAEDPLRVLRGMQFIARFELKADPHTLDLCRTLDPQHLPQERLWEEWKKLLLKGRDIFAGLRFLQDCGWLSYFPELAALVGCAQDPHWHPEGDVWQHTGHCLNAYARNRIGDDWEDLVVGLAVLCHDFGKPDTSYVDRTTGRIRSPRHDVLGVPVAQRFLERITRQKKIFDEVLPLVEQHMRPLALYRDGAGDSAIRRLAARVKRLDRLARRLCRQMRATANPCGRLPRGSLVAGPRGQTGHSGPRAQADPAGTPPAGLRHSARQALRHILDRCYEAQLDGAFEDAASGVLYLRKLVTELGY